MIVEVLYAGVYNSDAITILVECLAYITHWSVGNSGVLRTIVYVLFKPWWLQLGSDLCITCGSNSFG